MSAASSTLQACGCGRTTGSCNPSDGRTNEIDIGALDGGYETLEKTLREDTEWPFPLNFILTTDYDVGEDEHAWAWWAGTSFAAAQVSGAAALVAENNPDANARQVEEAILSAADLVDGRSDSELGAGRLNNEDALE